MYLHQYSMNAESTFRWPGVIRIKGPRHQIVWELLHYIHSIAWFSLTTKTLNSSNRILELTKKIRNYIIGSQYQLPCYKTQVKSISIRIPQNNKHREPQSLNKFQDEQIKDQYVKEAAYDQQISFNFETLLTSVVTQTCTIISRTPIYA
ncbi:unnamed protein product (macronuclear) [Paramecium tetraurelia]|uniref:Uncharacterized protein n=1 Tax=Paramecium tetraurelia TaxID=5888 RepID=A0CI66_PARTE|nr:uncharacterized protein GSPATT00007618001 [Paramecium tetraurelia]CAK70483.1 unnamed protein product [Paramecium tetraurelia]|eukprot:XP_001437880.1 hypothetical protein (macronuclear) [Paramecium tetraurelia strain d4-2]